MKRVTGMGGIFFKSADPKALGAWHKTHLGLDVEEWGGAASHWKWQTQPRRRRHNDLEPVCRRHELLRSWQCRIHDQLRVEDLHALLATLRAEGVQVEGKVEVSEYGMFGWMIDPDGNKLELWQPPQGQ